MYIVQQEREAYDESNHSGTEYSRKQTINGLAASYCNLVPGLTADSVFEEHYKAANNIFWEALINYDQDVKAAHASADNSVKMIYDSKQKLYETTDYAEVLNRHFPPDVLEAIAIGFIDPAIDGVKNMSKEARYAAADLGLNVGSGVADLAKVQVIKNKHRTAAIQNQKNQPNIETLFQEKLALNMLGELGVNVSKSDIPSVAESVAQYTKVHARSFSTTGITAVMAATVAFSPGLAAAASEHTASISMENNTPTPTIQLPEKNTKNDDQKLQVVPVVGGNAENTPITPKAISVVIDLSVPEKRSENKEPALDTEKKDPELKAQPKVVIDVKQNEPIAPLPEASPAPEASKEPEAEKLTPEQNKVKAEIEQIVNAINKESDINLAATLIRLGYHAKDSSHDLTNENSSTSKPTNVALRDAVIDLEIIVENVVNAKGHIDVNYSNTAYMTLAVLEAIANDPSVWQSEDIKKLVVSAKAPEDPYQAKLFAQYLQKATDVLAANDSALLANIDAGVDGIIHTNIKTMYAYALLAAVSDSDQATQIQGFKDEEAKAAAEQTKAKEQLGNPQTVEAEALKNLIDRAPTKGSKRVLSAFSFFKQNTDLGLNQVASIIFGLMGESGVNLDPGAIEEAGGYGHGIAQWEKGRFESLKEYAKAHNKEWTDFDLQLNFLLSELPNRNNTLNLMKDKESVFDATRVFVIKFETPRIVLNALDSNQPREWAIVDAEVNKRIDMGKHYLNEINAEIDVVNAARAATEAARVAAEVERIAKMGMNIEQATAFMDSYKNNGDSEKYLGGSYQGCTGGPLSNCVSLSVYFVNKFTNLGGMLNQNPGDGRSVVGNIVARNPEIQSGATARPFSVFSNTGGKYGHTGIILGVDETKIASDGTQGVAVVGEAFCGGEASLGKPDDSHRDIATEYPLSMLNNGNYTFAYSDGHLKGPVQ